VSFNESENKKIGSAKKVANCKADDDLVKIFKEDSEVNKKRLALEMNMTPSLMPCKTTTSRHSTVIAKRTWKP
jgi:hypothetical protein